jgi:bacillithiol synthase
MTSFFDTPLPFALRVPADRADGGWPRALDPAVLGGADGLRSALADPRVLVVTTGQQPGLFTGPLYTIHKALSARALASELAARWQRPVVPVFWVAGDDHDFAEASVAQWLSSDGTLLTSILPERAADAPLVPIYREPLPAEAMAELDRLESAMPLGPARDQTMAWLRRHYRPGATLGSASAAALGELLSSLGIICLDGSHRAVKQLAAPLLLEAIERSSELERALVARQAVLERAGQARPT